MAAPATGRTGRPLTQHEYFLRTDADYRNTYATEVMLRMAKLVEVLALRSGLEFDPNTGELLGLTEDEEKKLMAPAVDRNEVREARPVHAVISPEVREMDIYAARPDPSANFGSEKIEDVPAEPGYLVDHSARNYGYNPSDAGNADVMADTEAAQYGESSRKRSARSRQRLSRSAGSTPTILRPCPFLSPPPVRRWRMPMPRLPSPLRKQRSRRILATARRRRRSCRTRPKNSVLTLPARLPNWRRGSLRPRANNPWLKT